MLEGQFSNDWRSFARQYAMVPGNAAAGYRPDPSTETQLDGVFAGFRHTQISPRHTSTRTLPQARGLREGSPCARVEFRGPWR